MSIKVKFLAEDEIEEDAELLLAEYEDTIGEPIKLPVPVDEITTYHLALQLGFDNLHKTLNRPVLHGQPDILGAIWIAPIKKMSQSNGRLISSVPAC